jgi:hypothetical protein
MSELLSERLSGVDALNQDHYVNGAMERGTELEPFARAWYEEKQGVTVEEVGFVYALDGRCGVSPDGLVGNDGGVEIKCPLPKNHVKHLIAGVVPKEWIVQIHGNIWACSRSHWDFVCFCDDEHIPSMIVRVERDEVLCSAFDVHMTQFCDELDALELDVRERYGLGKKEVINLDELNPICETEETIVNAMEEIGVGEL